MIRLEKMGAKDFTAFNEINIKLLAESLEKDFTPEDAAEKAAAEQKELLPEGAETADQYLFTVKNNNETAGGLWFAPMRRDEADFAFLFFIYINTELRGSGIGSRAMELLEQEVCELGLQAVRLHVFKSNTAAVRVYEKIGYKLFVNYNNYTENNPGMIMEKRL